MHVPLATRVRVVVSLAAFALLTTIGARPAAAADPPGAIPLPDTIDATGSVDVTEALNAFLSRVKPANTVAFAANGRYRVEGTVLVANRRDLTLDGNGATLFATTDGSGIRPSRSAQRARWPRLRQQLRIRGGSGITVRDLVVQGANPNGGATPDAYVPELEGQAGITVQRATGVVLERVRISDTYGDAVYIVGGSTDVTIRGSTFERIGRQGVAVVNGRQVVVEDNEIRGVSRSVFDLEPGGRSVAEDIRLRNNRIGDYGNFLLAAGGGGPGVNDVWLEGNEVDGGNGVSVYAGIVGRRRVGYRILDNIGTGEQRPPPGTGRPGLIQLLNLDGVVIRGNRQPVGGVPAISLDRVCGTTVTDNEFPGARPVQEVVAPCGAAGPGSTTSTVAPPPTTTAGPPTVAAAEDGGGGDGPWSLLGPGLVGFAAGLAVAFAVFVARRRGRAGPSS